MALFDIKRATAQRDLKILKDTEWIDFEGAPKTGKYRLSPKGRKYFEKVLTG
jgi:ATP-dependent DNA helicase RecG